MKKSVKFLGLIVLLMVIGSLFVGVVSAEDIMTLYPCSGDTRSFCASTAETYSVKGDVERVSNETDTIGNRKAGKVSVSPTPTPTPAPVTRYRTDGETYTFVTMWPNQYWHLRYPEGIAVDSSGYVYVTDWDKHRIQKFDSDGTFITTWGRYGTGDGEFHRPRGIAVDSSGYVYVADTFNDRIQKFDSDGNFITKWGSSGQFDYPNAIAVDSSGYVYVADTENHRIQKFDSDGNFITKWGSSGTGDGEFSWPAGIAVDSSGYVYVADWDNNRIQKFDSVGNFITKWGVNHPEGIAVNNNGKVFVVDNWLNTRILKFDSDGNFITTWGSRGSGDGEFDCPCGIAVDSSGYVYVADTWNDRIQKFDSDGNFITKWGSSGTGDGQFNQPEGIAVDSSGYVFVADTDNHRIQKFDSDGNFITKWGSSGTGDGEFHRPRGIAVDSSGYVYVADSGNDRIQKFDSDGNFITKWGSGGHGDGEFWGLRGIAVDSIGYVYVADRDNYRIQKFDSDGTFITTWGSSGTGDGQFNQPAGIAVDSSGYVYVADSGNRRIQKFDSDGNFITKWGSSGTGDGEFYSLRGIAVDSSGYVYVADSGNHRIQKFDSDGNFITKWGGSSGTGDGEFYSLRGIAVDSSGYVYVADSGNHRIQKFAPGIPEEPSLSFSPSSHDFGDMHEGDTDSTTFELWNSGTGTLTYSLSETCGWVEVNPTGGSSTGEHDTITVDINTTGLSEGAHTCNISISSNDGSGTFIAKVNVVPLPNCTCGDICVNETGWWRDGGAFTASDTPIQSAVDNATAGETICVKDGTYTENVDVNKQLTIQSENGADSTIVNALDPNDHVFEVTANHVNISGFTVKGASSIHNKAGICLGCPHSYSGVAHCTVSNNIASNNNYGIYLYYSSTNNVSFNNVSNNRGMGIVLEHSSHNNIVSNRASNIAYGDGIRIAFGSANTVFNNTASNNLFFGITLIQSSSNNISCNIVSHSQRGILIWNCFHNNVTNNAASNNGHGIHLEEYSSNNTISGNSASLNSYGIRLDSSSNNFIYNNYFTNTNNAYDDGNNTWNITKREGTNIINGSYLGGNYWSDYSGSDTTGDGLGNTLLPYNASGNIATGGDWHPLTTVGIAPPEIISFAPPSPVNDTVCTWRTFNVTVNQTVNVSWYLNNTLQHTNVSTKEASYTLHAEVVGEHNVTAVARNPNGTAMQTWIWNVTEESSHTFECSAGWNMISFPVEPLDKDADAIFGPEYYYLVTWDPVTRSYVPVAEVETEIGYWLLVLADRNVTVLGTPLSEYNTSMTQGWNRIGSLWTATNVLDGTETVPADQMYPYIYGWCGDHYVLTQDIEPGLGYWALAYVDCELHVFPAPSAAPLPVQQITWGDNDWRVKLDVTSGAGTDVAEFGLHDSATDDFSAKLDVPEPPSPPPSSATSPYQQAYFYKPENPVVKKLSTCYIPHHFVDDDDDEYNSWLFSVDYSGDVSYVTVKWNAKDINAVPAEYSLLFIVDDEQIDMRTTPSYTFRAKTRTYEFEIRAITGGKKPDLVIEEEYEKGKAGSYTVFFVVKNIGTATAPEGHYATLYVDGVEKDKKLVPTGLEPGETYKGSFKTKVGLTGKVENIKVCADSYNDVDELDEDNNCLKGRWQPVAEKPTTDKPPTGKPPTDKPPKEKEAGLGD